MIIGVYLCNECTLDGRNRHDQRTRDNRDTSDVPSVAQVIRGTRNASMTIQASKADQLKRSVQSTCAESCRTLASGDRAQSDEQRKDCF